MATPARDDDIFSSFLTYAAATPDTIATNISSKVGDMRDAISLVSSRIGIIYAIIIAVMRVIRMPIITVVKEFLNSLISWRSTPMLRLTIGCMSGAKSIAPMMTELELMKRPKVAIIVARVRSTINIVLILPSLLRFEKSVAYCSVDARLKRGRPFERYSILSLSLGIFVSLTLLRSLFDRFCSLQKLSPTLSCRAFPFVSMVTGVDMVLWSSITTFNGVCDDISILELLIYPQDAGVLPSPLYLCIKSDIGLTIKYCHRDRGESTIRVCCPSVALSLSLSIFDIDEKLLYPNAIIPSADRVCASSLAVLIVNLWCLNAPFLVTASKKSFALLKKDCCG